MIGAVVVGVVTSSGCRQGACLIPKTFSRNKECTPLFRRLRRDLNLAPWRRVVTYFGVSGSTRLAGGQCNVATSILRQTSMCCTQCSARMLHGIKTSCTIQSTKPSYYNFPMLWRWSTLFETTAVCGILPSLLDGVKSSRRMKKGLKPLKNNVSSCLYGGRVVERLPV